MRIQTKHLIVLTEEDIEELREGNDFSFQQDDGSELVVTLDDQNP